MQTWIVILQLVLITAAFGLAGYLFLCLKRELYKSEQRRKSDAEASDAKLASLESELRKLREEVESLPAPAAPAAPAAGINLNRRTQALRMVKMGEGPEHIAAALSLPKNEVELLIKVQRLLLDSSN